MQNMQSMNKVVYWHKNQVSITYYDTKLTIHSSTDQFRQTASQFHDQLNNLLKSTPYSLQTLSSGPKQPDAAEADNGLNGIYIFPTTVSMTPGQAFNPPASFAIFYSIVVGSAQTMPGMMSMPGQGGTNGMSSSDTPDHTLAVINHLHRHKTINETAFDAMPNWFWSGSDDVVHGCPVSPPIPVEDKGAGQWKLTFTGLRDTSLQDKTGEGVTIFVLDTMPSPQILLQTNGVGAKNTLLQRMIAGMKTEGALDAEAPAINVNYVDVPGPEETAKTGKDVYGRLVGFPMSDHGLAVAGIVRDLAPAASIECIRILNDYGVGDTSTLYQELNYIQNRLYPGQDLHNKPVVVNLSLVVVPPQADWSRFGWDKHPEELKRIVKGLAARMASMGLLGVTFVASAGNDSDPRDTMMNPLEVRFGPRYPAAFLYDENAVSTMIPVGAVNKGGQATIYSNYPGNEGIGGYGGDLPRPIPWIPSAMSYINAQVDTTSIDGICGLYSASAFPALSPHDHYPPLTSTAQPPAKTPYPEYQPAQMSSWAYWSGTSFAAPIISALAALILQGTASAFKTIDTRKAIAAATTQTTAWTGLEEGSEPANGPIILVDQTWNPA